MPKLRDNQVPSYRLHRQSGQAVVTLDGRDFLLGRHGTPESHAAYRRRVAEWVANGRALPPPPAAELTVYELIARFWRHAQQHYRRPDGTPAGELENFRHALRPLKRLYGPTRAADFTALSLKAVREEMLRPTPPTPRAAESGLAPKPPAGWCRTHVNRQVARLKMVFKWAACEGLVPPAVHHGVAAVAGLQRGKAGDGARESDPVRPVPESHVAAVLPLLCAQVRAMAELQLLTGMRPGEVCAIRTCDVDTGAAGGVWVYRPAGHKTQHRGHERVVYLGPRCQKILGPFLRADLHAPVFSPAEAEEARRARRRASRKTPVTGRGKGRAAKPKRTPGRRYNVRAYCHAIANACDKAFPPPPHLARGAAPGRGRRKTPRLETAAEWRERLGPERWAELAAWRAAHRWHPHQLRHNAATAFRRDRGVEAAQVLLGHRTLACTQVYAEKNVDTARRIMAEVG